MKRVLSAAALVAGLLVPALVQAQSVGIAARGGTLGLGGEVSLDLNRWIGVRGGIGSIPVQPSATFSDIKYTIKPPSTLKNIGIDFYPGGSQFRLSGGLMFKHDIGLDAEPTSGSYDVNGQTYDASQVGSLTAAFAYNSTAPYATLGFASRGHFGLTFDIGAAFMGEPTVSLTANGPIASDMTFQQNLRDEQDKIQRDAGKYMKILPILSLGIRVGI